MSTPRKSQGNPTDPLKVTGKDDKSKSPAVAGPAVETDAASFTSTAASVSTATLVAGTQPPARSLSPTPSTRQNNSATVFAAPSAWRHLWPAWSHPNVAAANSHSSPPSDSYYVAIPTTNDPLDSDSESDLEEQQHGPPTTRTRHHPKPAHLRRRLNPLDRSSNPQPSGWRTCGLLLLALLLLKSLLLLLLLSAILFTLGPLARHHHGSALGDERVAQLEINHVHVHNWTQDAAADPVANVDLSAKMLVTDGDGGGGGHDAWWAKWVKWVDGHVQVGEAQYDMWLENPLQPVVDDSSSPMVDKVKHDVASAVGETSRRLINKILADVQAANPHDPPASKPIKIGTATVPAFRPRLSTSMIDASIQDASIALDPKLVFKWASPYANLGSEAPPMKLRLVGLPKVSVGWVGKPVKVVGLAKINTAAAFRADYDWKAEDIRFDPGTLLARNTLKSTAALLSASGDNKDDDDDPPVPTEYLLHFTLTFLNPHPLSLALPLAVSTPIYSHDEHSNDPLAHLVGDWLDAPGLTIPSTADGERASVPLTLRIPTSKLPKVFSMLQQYHRGERVSIQVGPGTQMAPSGRLAGVLGKAHGIVSVQKGRERQEGGLDGWVARAGRSIVERVMEWGQEHLVGGAW